MLEKLLGGRVVQRKLWRLSLLLLVLANIAYFLPAPFGWVV